MAQWPGTVVEDSEIGAQQIAPVAPAQPQRQEAAFPGEVGQDVDRSTGLDAYAGGGAVPDEGQGQLSDDGSGEFARPEDRAFAAKAQELLNSGGQRPAFDALSRQYGYPLYGADLDQAIAANGVGYRIGVPMGGRTDANMLAPIANSSIGQALGAAADTGAMGLSDEIAGIVGGDSIGDVLAGQGEAQRRAQLLKEAGAEEYPVANIVGSLTGAVTGAAGIGKLAGRQIAGDAAFGAVYGAGSENENRLSGAALGGVTAGAGSYFGGKLLDKIANRAPSSSAKAFETAQNYGIDLPLEATGRGKAIVGNTLSNMPGSAQVMQGSRDALADQVSGAVDEVAGGFGPSTSFAGMGEAAQTGARKWIDKFQRVAAKVYDAIPVDPKAKVSLVNTRRGLDEITQGFKSNPELSKIWTGHPRLRQTLEALTPADTREAGKVRLTMEAERLRGAQRDIDEAQATYDALSANISPADPASQARKVATKEELDHAKAAYAKAKAAHDEAYVEANQPPMGGEISWEDMKRLRSIVGEIVGDPGLAVEGNAKAALRKFYGIMSEDMKASASAQGPAALKAFERANTLYNQGQDRIEGALSKILGGDGKGTAETAASRLQTIAKEGRSSSDLGMLAEIRKSMPAEEWGQVQNALIRLAGQPLNKSGRDFDPGVFARTFKDMSPAAKNLIFGKGELRTNLDEFTGVLESLGKVNALRNTSNTAGQVLTGLGFSSVGGLPAVAAQAATTYSLAKLWTNPRFVKWATGYTRMARAAAQQGGQPNIDKQMGLLRKVAAAEPAIAQDALGLQNYLAQHFSGSPGRLAAEDQSQPVENAP